MDFAKDFSSDNSSFNTACANGDIETIRAMLDQGHSPNDKGLYWIPELEDDLAIKILEIFYEKGAKPDDSIIQAPACNGDLKTVKYLVERFGINPSYDEDAPVIAAASMGHMDMVKYLVGLGANPLNPEYEEGAETAMSGAICKGHLEMVKYLIDSGATIPPNDDYFVKLAEERGHQSVVDHIRKINST